MNNGVVKCAGGGLCRTSGMQEEGCAGGGVCRNEGCIRGGCMGWGFLGMVLCGSGVVQVEGSCSVGVTRRGGHAA